MPCAICTSDAPTHTTAIDGVEYQVCNSCDYEHPRLGRYSFEGGRPGERSTSFLGSDGKGNKSSIRTKRDSSE